MLEIFRRRAPDARRERLLDHVAGQIAVGDIRSLNGAWTDGSGSIARAGDDATFVYDEPYLSVLGLDLRLTHSETTRLNDALQDRVLAELTRREPSTKGD